MPELPEVETVRRSLEPHLLGARVDRVRVLRRDVIDGPSDPPALLAGATIDAITRRGKQLALLADNGRMLAVHLGMSGQFFVAAGPGGPDGCEGLARRTHVHVVWWITKPGREPGRLIFRDPRRFGGVWTLATRDALDKRWAQLGPDALTIDAAHLAAATAGSTRAIKAILLDQAVLAGVGNIYADEALFLSKIHPLRQGRSLSAQENAGLAAAVRRVLAQAVSARGSTLRDFVDAEGAAGNYAGSHAVYGRSGEVCVDCGTKLKTITVAQRTTVFCPTCQPRVVNSESSPKTKKTKRVGEKKRKKK